MNDTLKEYNDTKEAIKSPKNINPGNMVGIIKEISQKRVYWYNYERLKSVGVCKNQFDRFW